MTLVRTVAMAGVSIRPYQALDANGMLEAVRESVAEVGPWMPWCHPAYSAEDAKTWVGNQVRAFRQRSAYEFAVVGEDGRYSGGCGLNQMDSDNRRCNLGYWIRSSSMRRGIATSAVRLLHAWAFENTDLIRLEIVVAVGNIASQRVAEKAGAIREGVLRSRVLLHGHAHDAVMFSFTRPVPK